MENDGRIGLPGPSHWPVKIGGMVGGGVGVAAALLSRPDLGGFWQGLVAFAVVVGIGIVLGQFAGRMLSRPSSDRPADDVIGTP